MRFPGDGSELVQFRVERFRLALDALGFLLAQGLVEGADARRDLRALRFRQDVSLITQIFLRVPQEKLLCLT